MEITSELLQTIHTRAEQYAIARWNKGTPDRIELEGGAIALAWERYRGGEWDCEYEYIVAEDLTADLDAVAEERKRKEEEARLAMERERKFQEEKRQAQEKERRRAEYLKLKKEFEPQ